MISNLDLDLFELLSSDDVTPDALKRLAVNVRDSIRGDIVSLEGYDKVLFEKMMQAGDSPRGTASRQNGLKHKPKERE